MYKDYETEEESRSHLQRLTVLPENQFSSFLKGQREHQAVALSVPCCPREHGTLGPQFLSGNVPRKDHAHKASSPQYTGLSDRIPTTERQIQGQSV